MFGSSQMQVSTVDGLTQVTILTDITVEEKNKTGKILIKWISSPLLDLMVDSIVALILAAEASPVSVKCEQVFCVAYISLIYSDEA